MFIVSEQDRALIRAAFDERGEMAAAIELRRLFPGIPTLDQAVRWVRVIAGWRAAAAPAELRGPMVDGIPDSHHSGRGG